jgi:hypothetical protein
MGAGALIGDVKARLTLDTAAFDGPMKQSAATATASGRAIEQAAKNAATAQSFAAKFAGDTINQQTLRIIEARKNESVASADMRKAQALNKAGYLGEEGGANLAAAALQRLAAAKTATAAAAGVVNHATISQMQATSAAVRSMEGNPGIRATERFLTTIPGVGKALQIAFPLIGGMAFGAMIVEMGSKVAEFIKGVQKMPEAIEQGFASLNLAQRTTTDELDLATDKIQNELDKLAKKPENNLKIAFDEAKLAADRFAASVENSNAKMDELLSKNHISGMATLIGVFGTVSTAGREGTTKAFGRQADSNAYELADATARGDAPGMAAAKKKLLDTQNARLAEARADLAKRQEENTAPAPLLNRLMGARQGHDRADNANVIADDKGIITTILNQQQQDAAQVLNTQVKAEKQIADDKKAAEEEKKKAAAEALAARKAADAAAIAQANEAHQAWQAAADRSKGDEVAYWAAQLANVKAGSALYRDELKKSNEAVIALHREESEAIASFTKEYLADFNKPGGGTGITEEDKESGKANLKVQGDAAKDYIQSLKAMKEGQEANADAIAKASIQMQLATGNMTKLAAAQALAAMHAQDYRDAGDKLDAAQAIAENLPDSMERTAKLTNIQTSRTKLDSNYSIQYQQDQNATNPQASSALTGATGALEDFMRAAQDSAAQMRKFVDSALGGFNAEAVKAISGQRTSFGSYGAGLARDVAGTALQKGEGSLLGLAGLGAKKKPTGAKGDPIFVSFDATGKVPTTTNPFAQYRQQSGSTTTMGGGAGGGIMGFISGLLGGKSGGSGGGSVTSSPAGGDDSGIVTGLADLGSFAGMFASGGTVGANMWGIVGENGPEPIFGGSTGATVLPNKSLNGVGGGGDTTHNWNIDARGSNDPAAVRAQIMAAAPHIAAAGVKAMQEQRARSPLSKH